jgi:hypothetical protein
MEAFSSFFAFMAGVPAIVGLFLTALVVFLTSDWRLSLTALLAQYLLIGLNLTRFIEPEVALVKILVGVLVVPILYLSARQVQGAREPERTDEQGPQLLGLRLGWDAGPLGLPLRVLAVLLVLLALIRLYGTFPSPPVSADVAFAAMWMGSMGMIGLVLGGRPLRVATAILTILAGFDLVYASLEPSLAVVGFFGALTLLTAFAFSWLTIVQGLGLEAQKPDPEGTDR